ncbi:hypothetical protein P3L10_003655 [Capsicum annuum]
MSPKRKEIESGSTSDHPTRKAIVQIDLGELLEQSQSGQNEAEESDNSFSPIGHLGKSFNELRSIMKKENIDGLFKKSCFAYFLELSEARPLHFPMIMVYSLLKCRIKYAGDDEGSKKGRKKIDEVFINYCGMPFCFGLKEFIIVMGLRCNRPEKPIIKETPHKGSKKCKDLMADLENKNIPKHYREKLCLVWFVHSILLARDIRKVIEDDFLALIDGFEKFNDYFWGYDSYYLTVEYLLKKLKPKTTTLFGFPWAFMAWACEVIPLLRKQFKDYPDKISYPRILRWVVHPWIVPTIDELGMTYFLTLGLVDIKEDPMVELIKKELAGAISIRRTVRQGQPNVEALHDQHQTTTDPCSSSGGIASGVVCDSGSHPDVAASCDYEHVVSKDREDKLLKNLEAITKAAEELKFRRGVIPSNEVREPCTPTVAVRRKRRKIRQISSVMKSAKIVTPPSPRVVEVQGPSKKVDIFTTLSKEKKKELEEFMKMKVQKEYTMHSFAAKDFTNIRNMRVWFEDNYVDEILCLMKGRQLAYLNTYDAADRIMDLNLYNNFNDRYVSLHKLAGTSGSRFDELVSTFQWDEEAIKYVRGKSPYPHGKSWTKAKRILAVMNVDVTYFLTIEILLYEGKIKVYDSNLPVFSEKTFLTHMQPLLKLLSKLLMQSKLMDHLPGEVLTKESWDFEGRNKNIQLPKNTIGEVCGPYLFAYIECLLTGTQITGVCDAVLGKMQWVWAYGVLTKWLDPVYKEEHVQRRT